MITAIARARAPGGSGVTARRAGAPRVRARLVCVATAALAALAAGCTDGSAGDGGPSTGRPPPVPSEAPIADDAGLVDVAVVLPPRTHLDEAVIDDLTERLDGLRFDTDAEIGGVRTAVPEDASFVGDLVGYFAEADTEVVCALGGRGERAVEQAAERYRGIRFCAVGEPGDDDVRRVRLRADELGHAVGVAARRQAGPGPVGVLAAGGDLAGTGFTEGLMAGLAGVGIVTPSDAGAPFTERAAEVLAAEPTVVVVGGGAGSSAIGELAGDDVLLLGPGAVLEDVGAARVLLRWRVAWELVVRSAVGSMVGEATAGESFGFREEAFAVSFGPGASEGMRDEVDEAVAAIVDGVRDPRRPAPGEALDPPDEDAVDADSPADLGADADEEDDAGGSDGADGAPPAP